jgi:hypothetical protein
MNDAIDVFAGRREGLSRDPLVVMEGARRNFLLVGRHNPLKSQDSDEGIQGIPNVFFLVFLGFIWFGLVRLGLAWNNFADFIQD